LTFAILPRAARSTKHSKRWSNSVRISFFRHDRPDSAIVDKSDNLLLDAATNSVTMGYTAEMHFE
jgi:hypothetical protein